MDAPPVRPLAPEEIHAVVAHLVDEFCRPVQALEQALASLIGGGAAGGETPTAPTRDQAPMMLAICQELRTMTREFLQYVWIDRGGTSPHTATTRLSAWVEATQARLAQQPETAGVVCDVRGPDAEVAIDDALTAAIIDRLIDNAVRYAPPGTPIRLTASTGPGVWRVVVEDHGPGIPAGDREKVFEPLTRLPRDVKAETPGSGLGLAVCRAVVTCLGGTITLDDADHPGTSVRVELPRGSRTKTRNPPIDPVAKRRGR